MTNALISKLAVSFASMGAVLSTVFLNPFNIQAQVSQPIARTFTSKTTIKAPVDKSLKINQVHIFQGLINSQHSAVGYHHRFNGKDSDRARLVTLVSPSNSQGVYVGRVEILNPATGKWVKKLSPSTFFPDRWSQDQVLSEIRGAFATVNAPKERWQGISPSGIRIEGFYSKVTNSINTAYPIYRK